MATRDEISLELRQQRMTETIKTYETSDIGASQSLVTLEVFIGDMDNAELADDSTVDTAEAVTAINGLIWSLEQRDTEIARLRAEIERLTVSRDEWRENYRMCDRARDALWGEKERLLAENDMLRSVVIEAPTKEDRDAIFERRFGGALEQSNPLAYVPITGPGVDAHENRREQGTLEDHEPRAVEQKASAEHERSTRRKAEAEIERLTVSRDEWRENYRMCDRARDALWGEKERLTKERDELQADYIRRNNDATDRAMEIERLRALVEPARDLIENIRERGYHDNWKRLAAALRTLEQKEPDLSQFREFGGKE